MMKIKNPRSGHAPGIGIAVEKMIVTLVIGWPGLLICGLLFELLDLLGIKMSEKVSMWTIDIFVVLGALVQLFVLYKIASWLGARYLK